MNGIPVYPLSKNGERPYLASPKTQFSDPFFGLFGGIMLADYAGSLLFPSPPNVHNIPTTHYSPMCFCWGM